MGIYAFPQNFDSDQETTVDVNIVPDSQHNQYATTYLHNHRPVKRSNYIYLAEEIDAYLLNYAPQPLRRMRVHLKSSVFDGMDDLANFETAIINSNADISAKDPLSQTLFSSKESGRHKRIQENSKHYEENKAIPLIDDLCDVPNHNAEWMLTSHPTCNLLHEFDFPHTLGAGTTKLLGNGYWRNVWRTLDRTASLPDKNIQSWKKIALKTIRYEHDYTEYNIDRHRRDALASDRLTSSPFVVSMFAYCGHSGFYEYSTGGTLDDRIREHLMALMDVGSEEILGLERNDIDDVKPLDRFDKLYLAYQVALALADTHDADGLKDREGNIISGAIVHADITTGQFIDVEGRYKLNDFNRCRFMRRYRTRDGQKRQSEQHNKPCGFYVENNPSIYRSPEEYSYEEETEKIDIYSMGNIFYTLLTDLEPWDGIEAITAQNAVKKGLRPNVPNDKLESKDFVEVALRTAMFRCWKNDPIERPRARDIANFFSEKIATYAKAHHDKNIT
ncbi:hypothetical protein ACHAXS_005700 [Conticribra weissflogii]